MTVPCATMPNHAFFIVGNTYLDWSFAIRRVKTTILKLKCTVWSFHLLGSWFITDEQVCFYKENNRRATSNLDLAVSE